MLLAFGISSCESELELASPSSLTAAGFWDTESGALAGHNGLYGDFRSQAGDFWGMGELRSDLWGGETYESPSSISTIESSFSEFTGPYASWAGFYAQIHRINDFLENVPNTPFVNESVKNHILAQAYGLRAWYYYTLLKTYGDVPISTEVFDSSDLGALSKARSPQTEVMALIKSDIEMSLTTFGSDDSFYNGKRTYWSKAATLALKGDVHIWSGNLMGGGTADFNTAKTALQQIATISGIGLEPSFAGLWGTGNETNNEFIFAIDYAVDQASNIFNTFTGRSTEINPQFDYQGNPMTDFVVSGSNRYGPSEELILLLDDNDDARKHETFIYLYPNNAGYPNYDASQYFGSILNKFLGRVDGSVRFFDNNVPMYRYADVVLLIAEAKNLLGEDPSGEINQIRARAYGANYDATTHAYVNGSPTDNANAILDERYKEFVAEGKRWWDLRRAGDSYVFDNIDFISSGEAYKLLLPIREGMIGANPLLTQTSGWTGK